MSGGSTEYNRQLRRGLAKETNDYNKALNRQTISQDDDAQRPYAEIVEAIKALTATVQALDTTVMTTARLVISNPNPGGDHDK